MRFSLNRNWAGNERKLTNPSWPTPRSASELTYGAGTYSTIHHSLLVLLPTDQHRRSNELTIILIIYLPCLAMGFSVNGAASSCLVWCAWGLCLCARVLCFEFWIVCYRLWYKKQYKLHFLWLLCNFKSNLLFSDGFTSMRNFLPMMDSIG